MREHDLVGIVLVAGLVVFFVGAGGWRLAYDRPLREALPVIHVDRRRRAWIHVWMIPAVFLTSAGVFGLAGVVADGLAATLALMAGAAYALGSVCCCWSRDGPPVALTSTVLQPVASVPSLRAAEQPRKERA